jgi:hypothetical protein
VNSSVGYAGPYHILYSIRQGEQNRDMSFNDPLLLLCAGLVLAASVWAISHYLSKDARLGRRRRRNNYRIEPKVRRPMIRLNARTRKKRK